MKNFTLVACITCDVYETFPQIACCNHHNGSQGPDVLITLILSICPIDALLLREVRETARIWKQVVIWSLTDSTVTGHSQALCQDAAETEMNVASHSGAGMGTTFLTMILK